MTYLLLQTFLLLLSSYFLGAFVACLIKRAMYAEREPVAVPVAASPVREAVREPLREPVRASLQAEPQVPRSIDPVQPKIDILPRPEPRAAPVAADTSRFDRALVGKEPPAPVQVRPAFATPSSASVPSVDGSDFLTRVLAANAKLPRRSIVEIRPAILKPVTAAAVKSVAKPAVQPPAAPIVKPAPVQAAAPAQAAAPVQAAPAVAQPRPSGPTDATTAAAAAAVAAAKAAAAASVSRPLATQPAAATQSSQPVQTPATQTSAVQAQPTPAQPAPAQADDDDFLRIRAIDEDVDRRLKALGVRRFDQMARWTAADVNRVNQALGLTDRIDREQWIEQAQILAKGGETYYSRNRAAASKTTPRPAAPSGAAPASQPAAAPDSPVAGEPPRPMTPSQAAAAAAAAAAAMSAPRPVTQAQPAPQPAAPVAATGPAQATPAPTAPAAAASPASAARPERSVAELAAAAAAAIAAASASVTRGHRPIEPISPLSKVDPNIVIPARLADALKEKEKDRASSLRSEGSVPRAPRSDVAATADDDGDDLKRIRGIGVLIEKRLNALGITSYREIANWTSADIDRISQQLDFKGRIERENWVEQARILSAGGHTEFSRRVDRGDVESSRDPEET